MTLSELLEAVQPELAAHVDWTAIILSREQTGERQVMEFPVFDLSVDEEDKEINLLTDRGASEPRSIEDALTLGAVVQKLRAMSPRFDEFTVFSGSAFVDVGGGYEGRFDAPLIGFVRNAQAQVFGFLEGPEEQWE